MIEQIRILNDLDISAKHLSERGVECEIVTVAPASEGKVPLKYIRTTSPADEYKFVAFPGDIVTIENGNPKRNPRPAPSLQNDHNSLPEIALYAAQELHEIATRIAVEYSLMYGIDGQNVHSADLFRHLSYLLNSAATKTLDGGAS
jgi:hypothetical protein|nr:MAG TPA: hypothetical protein [Caudoviricetes sp.]